MARSTQLKSILLLLCLSFGHASYSPWGKWILTSQHAFFGKINDQSAYWKDNSGFTKLSGYVTSDLTCSSLLTDGQLWYYGYSGLISDAILEFGVSVWMNLTPQSAGTPFGVGIDSITTPNYCLVMDNSGTLNFFAGSHSYSGSGISTNKWTFLVFYFIKTANIWTWNIISPEFTTKVSTESDNPFPGKYILLGYLSKAKFYEVQVFKSAGVANNNSLVIMLYDDNDGSYASTTSTCPCENNYCHSEMGCLSDADCQCSIHCICVAKDGVCSSCRDGSYTLATNCLCKGNFVLDTDGITCVGSNFYTAIPLNCVDGTSSTVCTQCETGYFLYDKGTSTTCLSCATSCSSCSASPDCFACADSVIQTGSSCRVDSIGYQLSFSAPNIVVDFAHPVSKTLTISNLKASTEDSQPIPTGSWSIDSSSTSSKLQIVTDLTESQLPISVDFSFEQSS